MAPCNVHLPPANPAMEEETQPPSTNEKKAPATLNTNPQKLRSCRLTIFFKPDGLQWPYQSARR